MVQQRQDNQIQSYTENYVEDQLYLEFLRSTNKELLRTIAFLTNATPPNKASSKAYAYDEDEEWITQSDEERYSVLHDEKGKQEHEMSTQNSSKNYSPKNRKKKSSHTHRVNKGCSVSHSSSHVIYVKDTIQTSDCYQEKLHRTTSNREAFLRFCSTEIICREEDRAALAVKLYGLQAALLSGLGNPFENLSQSMSSRNNSQILVLTLRQASTGFLPSIIWTGMFIMSFVYTIMVVWSLAFRVPIISMLCLSLLYCLSVLVAAASGFNVVCGTFSFRMNGIVFASLGVLSFVLLLLVLVMLVLVASWRRINQDEEANR